MKKEIKIIGAGISGLTAAINLAKAGYKVKVFEKNEVVGKRFHGDYQGIENWIYKKDALKHLKALNIKINFPYFPVNKANIIGPKGKIYFFKSDQNFFYLVKRGTERDTLDQHLLRQAKDIGVEIIFNSPKDHRKFGDIVAQGYFPDQVIDGLVVGYNFQTSVPDQHWVIVDDKVAPDAYAYCSIANGQATLAVTIARDFSKSKEYLSKAYKIFEKSVGLKAKNKKYFGGTSNVFWPRTGIFNRRLYVGEAGGFIDGMWGFGMKYAFITGYLAAQSIIKNKDYDQLLKRYVYPSLKASMINRWYYRCLNKPSYRLILKKMENSRDPIILLRKGTNYSFIHKIGFPFARFFLRKKLKDRRKFK